MNKKIFSLSFLIFCMSALCATDNSAYQIDDFEIDLEDVDDHIERLDNEDNSLYLMDLDMQDTPDFFNLHNQVDDDINYFLQDVKNKESIEKIIGNDLQGGRGPQENLIETINRWKRMSPKEFARNFNVLKNIAESDTYNHIPELKAACNSITQFIMQFINMPPNSLQALYFVEDNALAWQQWVHAIHMYL